MFAYKSQEIINGCMNFDKDTMTPTYTLTVGRPGSSYAFEIATKVGLHPKVVEYAKKRVGEENVNVDELLIDLQREKQELEQQLAAVGEKQQMLSKLIKTYDEQLKDVEFRRKKLKLDSKEMLLAQTAKENKEIEKMLRALRAEKDLEKARGLSHQIKAEQAKLGVEIKELSEEIYYQPSEIAQKPIEVGDFVKMKTGSATGKVETISKQDVVVIMGEMRMKLKLRDLQQAAEPLELRSRKSIETDFIQKTANFETQLDIRGLDMMTALKVLQDFMDNALMTSSSTVRIVHGKGDGVLRKVVKEKLREYKSIKRSYQPESFEGGDGVTIIEF
jgi:DNA mismatch repair protein MutS2